MSAQGRFAETSEEVEVRKEDQDRINEFGVIHQKLADLAAERKAIEEVLMNIEDAEQEVMLAEDNDSFLVQLGSTYVRVGEDEFNEFIEKKRSELDEKMSNIRSEVDTLDKEKADLKATLYARFGSTINLED
ncbi:Prefoldin subunit 4 [Hondaea fermentalgiana]|uniref:Prefoldin subunit 4 n=1 Tax=Hondaea fermentalgiana TaxID=2315210 RepID=A0A2R5GAS6_9STRA|nr:Prefoldin subunit 4 [Hondaea fermentalgiana]|eukprot:GBG25191.1 Prefoldin subunit 4 [Hondaea fermentalgiana]